ncbi:MutS-related protein [Elizabethkingia anophelis]|uniref:MutS-related protein n=1 Tax=Elizabethkingia anophelis TaxID=1117645 RepID=UPI0038927DC2
MIIIHNKPSGIKKIKKILGDIERNVKNEGYKKFWNFFYVFDMYISISKGIALNELIFPSFNSDNHFFIDEFKNLKLKSSVINSLKLTNSNMVIFTGANMSGKSTTMKSISTIIYLAHLGLAVPANYCNIPFYDRIFLFFTVSDNIEAGYSYFTQELLNLKSVLIDLKEKTSFVVFDEIFKGTNINDSSKITVKIIKSLAKYNTSLFILSTHLNVIEQQITDCEKVKVLNLESFFKDNELTFTYKIKNGWSKLEIGEILFEKYGLNNLL